MLCVTILGKIIESMKSVLNRTFFFVKILSLSFIVTFVSLSILTYHADDLSFNVATDSPVKNLCGTTGSHVADILVQIFGISSLVMIPLMIFCIVNMLYCVNRNIYLYLISSLVVVTGVSGLISNVSLKIIHKCYYCGVLGTYFHNFPIIVLLAIVLIGIVGVIGCKKIVYLYGIFLKIFSRLTCRYGNISDATGRKGIHQGVGQAQEFCNVKNLLDEEGLTKRSIEEAVEDRLADELGFLDREGLDFQIKEDNDDIYDNNEKNYNRYDDNEEDDSRYDDSEEDDSRYDDSEEDDSRYDDNEENDSRYDDNEENDSRYDECNSERAEMVYNKLQIDLQVIQEKKKE